MTRIGDDGSTASRHSLALERSLTQRLDALERANQIRLLRAQLKRDLKAGGLSVHTLLREPPDFILTAKLFDILLAVPRYGRVKVNKVLTQCRISPSKTIGGLSERQRDELLRLLRRDPREQQQPPRTAADMGAGSVPDAAAVTQLETARGHDELVLGVERLLEGARQVGRGAGRAARDAGAMLDTSAPRPDPTALQAELMRTLRASPGEGQLDAPERVEIRLARAQLKHEIAAGSVSARDVILACPGEAASMTIVELLTSQRRWGTARAGKFLAGIGMPQTRTVGSMTERQRVLLASML